MVGNHFNTERRCRESLPDLVLSSPCRSCSSKSDSDSSISTNDNDATESGKSQPARSIFNTYWEQKGGASPIITRKIPLTAAPKLPPEWKLDGDYEDQDDNTYERTLKSQEGILGSKLRRKIFPVYKVCSSAPMLRSLPSQDVRKTYSVSEIDSIARRKSCLRRKGDKSSEGCVVFSPQVSIFHFHTPKEIWGSKGWSEHFA